MTKKNNNKNDKYNKNIERKTAIVELNPDAPSETTYWTLSTRLLSEDLEVEKELVTNFKRELDEVREKFDNKEPINLNTLIENMLTFIDQLRTSETGKHPRDPDGNDDDIPQ